jgi:hypothetical protein
MLGRWIKELQAHTIKAFRGHGKLTADQEEYRRPKMGLDTR